jgi:hypothetical protein
MMWIAIGAAGLMVLFLGVVIGVAAVEIHDGYTHPDHPNANLGHGPEQDLTKVELQGWNALLHRVERK